MIDLQAYELSYDTQELSNKFCKKVQKKKFCMEYKVVYPDVNEGKLSNVIKKEIPSIDAKSYVTELYQEIGDIMYRHSDHYDELYISILSNTKHIFSLNIRYHRYHGGAHPSYGVKVLNFDKKTGKALSLDALFVQNYRRQLSVLAENRWILENGLDENYIRQKETFELPLAIGIGTHGLVLQYGQFEGIARNASFTIPYYELQNILKSNALLSEHLD